MNDRPEEPDALMRADAALASALSTSGERLTLDDLTEQTGASRTLLEAMEREGLLVPDANGYSGDDRKAVVAGMALLSTGVPLSELLDLARRHDAAVQQTADAAVELFARYIRDAIAAEGLPDDEAAEELVGSFELMLPATDALISHHFRRRLLAAARARLSAPETGPA